MDLNYLLNSPDSFLRGLAFQAQRIKAEHDSGEMDDVTYQKEVTMLTDLEAQGELCNTEDSRQQVAEAVGFLAQFLAAV